eukprot:g4742.t1
MAQIGSFVPAEEMTFSPRDKIFTRLGFGDSIETNSSSFMVEMQEMNFILRNSTPHSFVIIDELGRATSTADGVSIAWAVCERLIQKNTLSLVATHFQDLAYITEMYPSAKLHFLEVKLQTTGMEFLWKLQSLTCEELQTKRPRSYGIELAKLVDFPEQIIIRARQVAESVKQKEASLGAGRAGGDPVSLDLGIKLLCLTIQAGEMTDEALSKELHTFAAAIDSVAKLVKEYIEPIQHNPDEKCTVKLLEELVAACSLSVAGAFTSAKASVEISGTGEGCSKAKAHGDTFALSFAEAYINVWMGVTDGISFGEAEAYVKAISSVLASAWAKSKAEACQKNTGSSSDDEVSFAVQVRSAFACVSAELAVKLCKSFYNATVEPALCSACEGGGKNTNTLLAINRGLLFVELHTHLLATKSTARVGACSGAVTVLDVSAGKASTGNTDVKACEDKYAKCCGQLENAEICVCGKKYELSFNTLIY